MNSLKIILASIFILFTGTIFAQKFVSKEVQRQFANYKQTEVVDDLLIADHDFRSSKTEAVLSKSLFFKIDKVVALKLVEQNEPILSIGLYTDSNEYVILDLINADHDFSDMQVETLKRETLNVELKKVFYRGVIRGNESESLAAIAITESEVSGFISTSKKTFSLGKLKDHDKHILYEEENLKEKIKFNCFTADEDIHENEKSAFNGATTSSSLAVLGKCVALNYTTEYDIYQELGSSINNVMDYVTGIHNQVATLYYNEGIITKLSWVSISIAPDPFTSYSIYGLLSQFQSYTSSISGDLAILLTFRFLDDGGGVAAGFNGLCNSNVDEKLAVASIEDYYENVPSYSYSVRVITHEFGHLFGSRHTHACVWNGNNTAIDGCGPIEGGCADPPSPIDGGTIMSYCNGSGTFFNGFGIQPGNVIRNSVNNASCLDACSNCILELTLFQTVTASQDFKVANTLTASSVINSNLNVNYEADVIVLKPGFHAKGLSTGRFRAFVNPCDWENAFSSEESQSSNFEITELNNEKISLFPNPANSLVTVMTDRGMLNITVTSLEGRLMYNRDVKGNAYDIDISTYAKGYYTVTITTENGEIISEKLIKN